MSDYRGAALMLPAMPKANALLADKGYDADWLRAALAERGLAACIPSKSNRKAPIPYDPRPLQTAPQNRKHVRTAQRLAAHPYPLRSLCSYLPLGKLRRRSRRLLALIKQS
jgi:IS5 family transposase